MPFAAHPRRGERVELGVHRAHELLESDRVAVGHLAQQDRDGPRRGTIVGKPRIVTNRRIIGERRIVANGRARGRLGARRMHGQQSIPTPA